VGNPTVARKWVTPQFTLPAIRGGNEPSQVKLY